MKRRVHSPATAAARAPIPVSAAIPAMAKAHEWLERAKLPAHRTILDLPLLELECMKVLWQLGEAPVSRIREILSRRRALAYTTIETLVNRLVKKGVAGRRKQGPIYVYWAECSRDEACQHALQRLIDHFFGSRAMLQSYLSGKGLEPTPRPGTAAARARTAAWTRPIATGRRKPAKAAGSKPEPPAAPIETSLL